MAELPPEEKRQRRPAAPPRAPPADQVYFSQSAFARRLGVSRVTVWRWIQEGRLRYVRLSPQIVRIPVTEIERLGRQHVAKRPALPHLTRRAQEDAPAE
jgi:excisionase family DNA binding protein